MYLKNMIFFGNFIQIGLILHEVPPYTKLGLLLLVHTTTKLSRLSLLHFNFGQKRQCHASELSIENILIWICIGYFRIPCENICEYLALQEMVEYPPVGYHDWKCNIRPVPIWTSNISVPNISGHEYLVIHSKWPHRHVEIFVP